MSRELEPWERAVVRSGGQEVWCVKVGEVVGVDDPDHRDHSCWSGEEYAL